jgi:hypothetical protein
MTPAKLTIVLRMLDTGQHTITEITVTVGMGRGTRDRQKPR